ncbi:hypothetical protein K461DRAFT_111145 [Myriangium duriaei CBS 260.36]|uniref:Uncharacterized protein n=1 Tax=Myriangium duriaei CBS 260.36 TaxID=1168546 RepID=A0A9P4J4J4_9PEZI|nr:hypothetical protein K461DRAFT_111145 [Myriangium duriaei CBS 260.36]
MNKIGRWRPQGRLSSYLTSRPPNSRLSTSCNVLTWQSSIGRSSLDIPLYTPVRKSRYSILYSIRNPSSGEECLCCRPGCLCSRLSCVYVTPQNVVSWVHRRSQGKRTRCRRKGVVSVLVREAFLVGENGSGWPKSVTRRLYGVLSIWTEGEGDEEIQC